MGVSLADEGCVSSQALVMELVQDLPLAIHVSDATRDDVVIETWPAGAADLTVVRSGSTVYAATLSYAGVAPVEWSDKATLLL